MINITVKLFATFRDGRFKVETREYSEGSVVRDVLSGLHIKAEEVAICLVNGRDGKVDTVLREGDTLSLFPPVGGG